MLHGQRLGIVYELGADTKAITITLDRRDTPRVARAFYARLAT